MNFSRTQHFFRRIAGMVMAVGLLAFPANDSAWAKVYLDIDSPTFQQFVVAVPDYRLLFAKDDKPDPLGSKIADTLSDYLRVTGFFSVVDKRAYPSEIMPEGFTELSSLTDWMAIGSEYLVRGTVQYQGNDLIVDSRVYDVVKAELVLGKRYMGTQGDVNAIVRRFASEVILALTGEGGIFSTRIAFIMKRGKKSDLYSINFDGTDLVKEKEGSHILMSPKWSPDGRYIAFTSFEDGKADFFLKDRIKASIAKITAYAGINLAGGWSPDGKKILLTLSKDGNEEIYSLDFENRQLQRLTNDFSIDVSPVWSPDGRQIAFVSNRSGSPQIYVMDVSGKNIRRLTMEGSYNTSPAWSPKGDRIAFEGKVDGIFQIFTIGSEGENLRQVTFGREDSGTPAWSPDGRYLVIGSSRQNRKHIQIISANGSYTRTLFEGSGDAVSPSWSLRFRPD